MQRLDRLQTAILKDLAKWREEDSKKMNDFVTSHIRTFTPVAVGQLAAWLITLGIELDADTQAGLILALGGLVTAVYYFIARKLEQKFPSMGWLLGSKKQPEYNK